MNKIATLAKIANRLDSLGLTREADVLDSFIRKIAEDAASGLLKEASDQFLDSVNRNPDPGAQIVSLEPMPSGKFLFHGSSQRLSVLDPALATTRAYGFEYTVPVVFASEDPSSLFTSEPVGAHKKLVDDSLAAGKGYPRVYHMVTDGDRQIYLGSKQKGFIHVVKSDGFYKAHRRLLKSGKWVDIHEIVSPSKVEVVEAIPVAPLDWESTPHYEHIPALAGRTVSVQEYLDHVKDPTVREGIEAHLAKPFVPGTPEELEKYLSRVKDPTVREGIEAHLKAETI
jgi:hypothetical protein